MGFFDGYNVATSGMSAQRTRINTVSANIANAQTTHSADGGPYKKQNVIFQEILLNKQAEKNDFGLKSDTTSPLPSIGVGVREIVDAKGQPILRFEPSHPDANKEGYVAYPDINPVIEMTDLIEAMRSYEANLSAFKTQKTMDTKTIDILKG
ncbi:MAG TPA: flagellar basal body rod protein FlgC [Arcobacter sp.]|nr:flagellar basal body rod protein FlgC [Arcobacter sp.]HIP55413.1 flagellar basal body rod protein FlgC [Arcobacter sp.]